MKEDIIIPQIKIRAKLNILSWLHHGGTIQEVPLTAPHSSRSYFPVSRGPGFEPTVSSYILPLALTVLSLVFLVMACFLLTKLCHVYSKN